MTAPATETRPASDRQVQFLRSLLNRKVVTPAISHQIDTQLELGMGSQQASIFIDGLLRCADRPVAPVAVPLVQDLPVRGDHWPSVPEGRYAVTDPADNVLKFYQVDKPKEGKWSGFTFLGVFASEQRNQVRVYETKKRIMDVIAVNPQVAMQRYGQELGTCAVCGKELTDATSRAFGIGPVCRGKMGYKVKPGAAEKEVA